MQPGRTSVIACATVLEEITPLLPEGMTCVELDFGLHLKPANLKQVLQEAIDEASKDADTVLLGYGLCSMAVVGLTATNCTLVVPKVDDCIAIFLGSRQAYSAQSGAEPGTYYLTKGWIEVSDTIWDEYQKLVERHGEPRAQRMMRLMLKNYTRLAYIDTGQRDQDRYRDHARMVAEAFQLRYEEVQGSNRLIEKLLQGPWDDEFVVAEPGQTIAYADFQTTNRIAGNSFGITPAPSTSQT